MFKFCAHATAIATGISIGAAIAGAPIIAGAAGAAAVVGFLHAIEAAMKETTQRTNPKAPETSSLNHKDTRPAP